MFRPILIIGRLAGADQEHKVLFCGEDSAAAETLFAELSALPEFAEIAIYFYPPARQTAYPASDAAVAALSRSCQRDVVAEDRAAAVQARARAKLKALNQGQLTAQALAEAEQEIAAAEAAAATTPAEAADATAHAHRVAEKVVDVIRDELTPAAQARAEPAPDDDPAARFGAADAKPAKKPGPKK